MKMKLRQNFIKMVLWTEHFFCPDYCGIVDRRRIIAFILFTLIETLIILYHFILMLRVNETCGFWADTIHLFLFSILQYSLWTKKITFNKGVCLMYIFAYVKLTIDSVFGYFFGSPADHMSMLSNIFLVFLIILMALTQMYYKIAAALSVGLVPLIAFYYITHSEIYSLFSVKAFMVGIMMIVYVSIYNTSYVLKGLRQPRKVTHMEKKALDMLANLQDRNPEHAGNLMERLNPELRQNIINNASEHLRMEELNQLAWDEVCDNLTKSEKQICKLILQGKSLKEICFELDKSESNITSQRCHIRKKLHMDRGDDLCRTLEVRFMEVKRRMEINA